MPEDARRQSWSSVVPERLRPKQVEKALEDTGRLAARVDVEQASVDAASVALDAANRADTAQMADAFRRGGEPTSDRKRVEEARASLAEAERRLEAAQVAHAGADDDLGSVIEQHADDWAHAVADEVERMRARARKALEQVESALADVEELTGIGRWLEMPQTRALCHRGLPTTATAARITSNRQPLPADAVLAFARELVDPPAPFVADDSHQTVASP
jgi:hypothetical protein